MYFRFGTTVILRVLDNVLEGPKPALTFPAVAYSFLVLLR